MVPLSTASSRVQKKTLPAGGRQAGSLGLTQPHGKRHVDFAHQRNVSELLVLEVEEPPAIIPFEGDFSPSQRYLRVRIERADIRPGGG